MPDVDKACERFEKLGVKFVKKPNDGKNLQCSWSQTEIPVIIIPSNHTRGRRWTRHRHTWQKGGPPPSPLNWPWDKVMKAATEIQHFATLHAVL